MPQAAGAGIKAVNSMWADGVDCFLSPQDEDMEGMIILSFWDDEANEKMAPKFWFVKMGLEEEKC